MFYFFCGKCNLKVINWCTGKTQRDQVEREVGGWIRMGNTLKKKKSRDITLPTKVHLVKSMVFPVVMYGCESWTVKKAEH